MGLNVIRELQDKYSCPVGLSDHSASPVPSIAAIAQGADIIEAHLTFHPFMYGPDVKASLTPEDFKLVCEARDACFAMANAPVNKDTMANELEQMRGLFTKSIAPALEMKAGTIIEDAMLAPKKPGTGIPYTDRNKVIGLKLKNNVSPDKLLTWDDFEGIQNHG